MHGINYQNLALTCQAAIEKLPIIEEDVPAEFAQLDYLTSKEEDNVIADMIVGYCRHGEWQDMDSSTIWKLSFRLRFAQNYFEQQHEAHPKEQMKGQEAMIQLAVAATDIWHYDAGGWMAEVTGAENILHGQYVSRDNDAIQAPQLERLIRKIGDNKDGEEA